MKYFIALFFVVFISGCDGTMDVIAKKVADDATPRAQLKHHSYCFFEVNFSPRNIRFYNLRNVISIRTQAVRPPGRHILFIDNASVANITFDEYLELVDSFKGCEITK